MVALKEFDLFRRASSKASQTEANGSVEARAFVESIFRKTSGSTKRLKDIYRNYTDHERKRRTEAER